MEKRRHSFKNGEDWSAATLYSCLKTFSPHDAMFSITKAAKIAEKQS